MLAMQAVQAGYPRRRRLYTAGVENVQWVNGALLNSDGIAKQSTQINCYAYHATAQAEETAVTDVLVNLTGINRVMVEWYQRLTSTYARSILAVSPNKMGNWNDFVVRRNIGGAIDRRIDVLDVSAVTGNHFIRAHARTTANGYACDLYIFNVWLER